VKLRFVPDRIPDNGPLAGVDAALAAAQEDPVIVVACDMPFVTAAFAERLIALAGAGDGPPAVVVPVTGRGYHPLCAVYKKACRTLVARHLAARRLALKDLLNEMSTSHDGALVRAVTGRELEAFGDPGRLLANVNTPAEYEELEALQRHQR
jgi:molybdopterin-guanine dinucleotide biosynthesis protein A